MGVPCPICGVEFANENGVCGHVAGKTDEEHGGLAYQDAREMLGEGNSSGSEGGEPSGGDGGLKFPENPDASDASDGCPDCGGEDYYATSEMRSASEWDDETAKMLQKHERVCADCGEVYS